MTSVALLLRRLSSFLPPLSPLLPRHSALLTPLVLGRLVQGIKPTQQVLTQPLGLGSLIPVFRLGAVERLAPGATGFHFLHGVEAVFQRGQVAVRCSSSIAASQPPMRSAQWSTSPRQARARKQALSPQMRHAQTRSAPKRNASSLDVLLCAIRSFRPSSSSSGLTRRSSSHRPRVDRDHRGYWIPACAGMTTKQACVLLTAARIRVRLMLFPVPPRGDGAPKNPNLWLRTVARHGGRLSARQSRRFQHRASLFPLEAGSNSVSSSVSQLLAGPPIGSGRSSDAAREPAVRQPARRRRYQRPAS